MNDQIEALSETRYFYGGIEWVVSVGWGRVYFFNKYGCQPDNKTYNMLNKEFKKQQRLLELNKTKNYVNTQIAQAKEEPKAKPVLQTKKV